MLVFNKSGYKQVLLALSAGIVALGSSACSTTKTVKVAQNAPITYKIGKGAAQYASVTMPRHNTPAPYTSSRQVAPQLAIPHVSAPQVARPRAVAPPQPSSPSRSTFDQSTVDRDLYKHQRVGKTYTIMGKSYTPKHEPGYNVVGIASWYGDKFHGKPTATGEIYDKNDMTAAHKTLPLNSMLHVTNLENGRTLMVRLNDRGPFIGDRIIDFSEAAAKALGTQGKGLGKVRVQYAGPADPMASKRGVPAPQPQVVEAPRPVTPAPALPAQPEYQPLRQQPSEQPSYEAAAPAPYTAPVQEYQTPRVSAPVPAPIAPSAPQPVAPQGGEEEGQVTLTIKGPIHVARHSSVTTQPRLIRGAVRP